MGRICSFFLLITTLLPAGGSTWAEAKAPAETIRIGAAFALTGAAASYGTEELRGATLARDEINSSGGVSGHPLEFLVEDTASTNLQTVNAITKLITIDKVDIIVGPTWLDSYGGALPIAEAHRVLLLTPSAVPLVYKKHTDDFPLVFSTFFNIKKEIEFALTHIHQQGISKLAIFFDEDPYDQVFHQALLDRAKSLGLTITNDWSFPVGTADFRTAMIRTKAAGAEGMLTTFADPAATQACLRQAHQLMPNVRLFGAHDFEGYFNDPKVKDLVRGSQYTTSSEPSEQFKKIYRTRFGTSPLMTAGNAYDAVKILAEVLPDHRTPEEIATALRAKTFDTVSFGKTGFDEWGGIATGNFLWKDG